MTVYTRQHKVFQDIFNSISNVIVDDNTSINIKDLLVSSTKQSTSNRDLYALVDFFVCASIPYFIGNSVSTFSALQIAIRNNEKSYWYNSQSIPLSTMIQGYSIPIVYTYTEHSKVSGKFLLQGSITSVRRHMPSNPIHILYDGNTDIEFLQWLQEKRVTIHYHNPTWRDPIEQMRLNGNSKKSNLFLHPGNYFGTWQRIDIPLFIKSEYCLLLDADTINRMNSLMLLSFSGST